VHKDSKMPKKSPHPIEKRRRIVKAYHDLVNEAVDAGSGYRKRRNASAAREVCELARAHGITSATIRKWAKQFEQETRIDEQEDKEGSQE